MSEVKPDVQQTLPPNYRRNILAFMGDWISFGIGMSFASGSTVLPALVNQLSGSPLAVGLISTLGSGGWLLPQLFAASRVHRLSRKKPAIIIPSLIGRPTFLITALAILYLAVPHPALTAAIFLAGFGIFNMCDGISSVPWFDLFSRAVPPWRRGRFIGSTQVISAILTIGVGGIVGYILSDRGPFEYPANYAALFFIAAAFLGLSMLFTLSIRETPAEAVGEKATLRDYVRELKGIWKNDRDFRLITGIRFLLGWASLATPFYTVYAINVKGVPMGTVGWFLSAQIAGGFVYSIIGGYLLERFGGRLTTNIEAVLALVSPVLGIVVGYFVPGESPWFLVVYLLLFAFLGAMNNSFMMGHMNYLLEMSPEEKRSIYVGLSNTIEGYIVVVPLLGGLLVNLFSYELLFVLTALFLAPTLALSLRLSEPRNRVRPAPVS
jgi:MFS family permease